MGEQTEAPKKELSTSLLSLKKQETAYLKESSHQGLEERYQSPDSDREQYTADTQETIFNKPQDQEFAEKMEAIQEIYSGKDIGDEKAQEGIKRALRIEVDQLFNNPELGRLNEAKQRILHEEMNRFVDLTVVAHQEGDIVGDKQNEDGSSYLSAERVLTLARENLQSLSFQDKVATTNTLGDHGVRHIVEHNIGMVEQFYEQLEEAGGEVRAVDVLMGHQIMIDHDSGYAMKPVREGVDQGNFSADGGHPLLSAKGFRQRAAEDGALTAVFNEEQISIMHEGILNHDSPEINFRTAGDLSSPEVRQANLESAIHLADNSHAFETKLPEVLYQFPDSLKSLRLMKIAGEIGDEQMVEDLKQDLKDQIDQNDDIAEDDKQALQQAVNTMSAITYKFTVGRICGNEPQIEIDQGKVKVRVTESAIHRETTQAFGQSEYKQLVKFIRELTGLSKEEIELQEPALGEPLEFSSKEGGNLSVVVEAGKYRATESTDYQQRVEQLINDPTLSELINQDDNLAAIQESLEAAEEPDQDRLAAVKNRRGQLLKRYLQ